MPPVSFLGMRATNDFTVDGQRPKNWREGILKLYPNGTAPLTALLALMRTEKTDDPEFNWYTQQFAMQAVNTTGVFTDAGLSTAVAAPSALGDRLYIQMIAADVKNFKVGHTVLLRNEEDPVLDTQTLVVDRVVAGAASYICVQLLQSGPTTATGTALLLDSANVNRALVTGSAHAEGALIPEAITYDPRKWMNYTQIFRNSLDITRTAKLTRLRTGPEYQRQKAHCLELHSVEQEKAYLFGTPSEQIGENGKPLRTTGGLLWAIKNGGGLQSTFTAATPTDWLDNGLDWFEENLMNIFNFGSDEKLAFAGNSALLALNQLARKYGTWNFTTATRAFGIDVNEFVTPFGKIVVKTHPLFSMEPTNQRSMVIFEPKNIRFRYITDTTFFDDDQKQGHHRYDGLKEEYLTEAGLEYHHPQGWGWLNGIGARP